MSPDILPTDMHPLARHAGSWGWLMLGVPASHEVMFFCLDLMCWVMRPPAALVGCVMADAGGVARVKMNGCAALASPPLPLPFITHQGSDSRTRQTYQTQKKETLL